MFNVLNVLNVLNVSPTNVSACCCVLHIYMLQRVKLDDALSFPLELDSEPYD